MNFVLFILEEKKPKLPFETDLPVLGVLRSSCTQILDWLKHVRRHSVAKDIFYNGVTRDTSSEGGGGAWWSVRKFAGQHLVQISMNTSQTLQYVILHACDCGHVEVYRGWWLHYSTRRGATWGQRVHFPGVGPSGHPDSYVTTMLTMSKKLNLD